MKWVRIASVVLAALILLSGIAVADYNSGSINPIRLNFFNRTVFSFLGVIEGCIGGANCEAGKERPLAISAEIEEALHCQNKVRACV